MKLAKRRKLRVKKPKYTFAQLLSRLPNVGRDEDFARLSDEMRVWEEMAPVGRELGAESSKVLQKEKLRFDATAIAREQLRQKRGNR